LLQLSINKMKAYEKGVVLAGVSAGSICWFQQGSTDSFGTGLRPLKCLGFLKGSNCPHYDGEAKRRPSYRRFIKSGIMAAGYAADDGVALHFINGKLKQIVSSRPKARAYRLSIEKQKLQEEQLETVYLNKSGGLN